MKLPKIKTKNLWIGNILYFQNGTTKLSKGRYLAIKSKKYDGYTIISNKLHLPSILTVNLGLDSTYNNYDKYCYLICAYPISDKILKGKLSFDEVIELAKEPEEVDKMPFIKRRNIYE